MSRLAAAFMARGNEFAPDLCLGGGRQLRTSAAGTRRRLTAETDWAPTFAIIIAA